VYNPGGPFAKEFRGHLTLNISNDGLVYAADRAGNRIHVTDKQGKFVKEIPDKEQRFLYVCDINNNHVWFIDRQTGTTVGQLGSMGRMQCERDRVAYRRSPVGSRVSVRAVPHP
jgi:DNA-binding beta-propeller fold protein YncE